ncbi:MAG: hypothetical protein FJ290_02305 [Planctomycetes bacterium]|nr:hypothetical protein [Planctomycetota bacterium]
MRKAVKVGNCTVEILIRARHLVGLGKVRIGRTVVRSGRLPLRPCAQTFAGLELSGLELLGIEEKKSGVRIKTAATFCPLPVKLLRDHSFDPIHETGDWDKPVVASTGRLDIVLKPARDAFEGVSFEGFSYHYEYDSKDVPLFYLMDMASWELDGNIEGTTAISQSSCSAPTATFAADTKWTTEGVIHWDDAASVANPVMTHNLPRWASHQAFDFQCKGGKTLLGIFERVALIRSILMREPGKSELKTFDKHIFDQTLKVKTSAKSILLNTDAKTDTDQRNVWTWVFDEIANRAQAEFGLKEEPLVPRLCQNYWHNFTIDTYRRDLLPAAVALGFKALFVDNLNKSAMTERCPHPDFQWNMCCGHEYEVAPCLGGPAALKRFIADCREHGIRVNAWTNNDQALSSPVNAAERDDKGWFVRMEDTRLKYGGAYGAVFSIMDMGAERARRYWIDCLKKIKAETGLDGYLYDSFYNLGFMPVNYRTGKPSTQWRGLLAAFKELQDAGVHFLIESFGPFGSPQHGCPAAYAEPQNLFACYKVTGGFGYTTIPTTDLIQIEQSVGTLYRFFAHMASPSFALFYNGVRIDRIWTERHKRVLADYNENLPHMHKRFLQEDGLGVLWHDAESKRATLWNFAERDAALPGHVRDLTAGQGLPPAASYRLLPWHTYAITEPLQVPTCIGGKGTR